MNFNPERTHSTVGMPVVYVLNSDDGPASPDKEAEEEESED